MKQHTTPRTVETGNVLWCIELNRSALELYRDHRRLTVFYNKGYCCAVPDCPREGYYLIAARQERGGGIHIDVYTKDFHLMTVDHILPKSKGGGEELENKQPMCAYHNTKKGNEIISNDMIGKRQHIH